jgi:hypothetical protein
MWESIGYTLAFAYSSYICTNVKLYILLSVLGAGMIGYTVIEIKEHKRQRNISREMGEDPDKTE